MDQIETACRAADSYSFWADLLAKFQIAPVSIQALSILALVVMVLGIVAGIAWMFREAIRAVIHIILALRQKPAVTIDPAATEEGQWIVHRDGEVRHLRLPDPSEAAPPSPPKDEDLRLRSPSE